MAIPQSNQGTPKVHSCRDDGHYPKGKCNVECSLQSDNLSVSQPQQQGEKSLHNDRCQRHQGHRNQGEPYGEIYTFCEATDIPTLVHR